jgi:hypothetical protein
MPQTHPEPESLDWATAVPLGLWEQLRVSLEWALG